MLGSGGTTTVIREGYEPQGPPLVPVDVLLERTPPGVPPDYPPLARTVSIVATLDSPVYPFAFDTFIAEPLAAASVLDGLRVYETRAVMNKAKTVGIITLGYLGVVANLACPTQPVGVPLPSQDAGQYFASQVEAYANAVLAPEALAAIASYGSPSPASVPPTSLVFSDATWAVVPPACPGPVLW